MDSTYSDVVGRIADIRSMIVQIDSPLTASAQQPTAQAPPAASFQNVLAAAQSPTLGAPVATGDGTSSAGLGALQAAETQVGQAEQPPGSNDGPAIAMYRGAVAGAYAGAPWCAYFVSWAAAQAGAPIGDHGQGLGSVAEITDWARSTGRLVTQPQPGDLILFGTSHVGIVESVNPDGSMTTVEGNASNAVSRETRRPWEATGYVRL
jgi:cell wall-associated NlpC family hydrolase